MTSALVRARPYTAACGPFTVTVRAAMADEWIDALTGDVADTLTPVVPGMCEPRWQRDIPRALISGTVTARQLDNVWQGAVAAASGRQWWQAQRLVDVSVQPTLYGILLLEGVDPSRVTLAGWCAAVYVAACRNLDDKQRLRFETDISLPPSGNIDDLQGFDVVQLG